MKNNLIVFILFVWSTSSTFGQNSQVAKNIKLYEITWSNIINKGQIELINTSAFDENIVMISSPSNVIGLKDFKAYYQNYLTGFSGREFTIQDIFGQGDKLVKHWRFKGIHTGDFFGIPATGKMVDVEGVTLVKMKNGKIAQEQDFMDNMIFLQQLGIASNAANVSVIDNLYKAFQVGNIPAVLAAMDSKIVWNEAESNYLADGNPYIGSEAILNGVFARIGANNEYFKLENIQLHEMSNNQVLATLRYNAKVKKTGKTYNAQVAHLWTLSDGKVIAFQQFVDTKKLADAEAN